MMLSRPVASGAMLVLLMGAVGAAALQQEPGAGFIGVPDAPVENADREATAADRVVESAGFPVVPQAERDRAGEATHGPIVTVNGRPLGEDGPAVDRTVAVTPAEAPTATAPLPQAETSAAETAAIEPPRPLPRPDGLAVPQQQDATGIDYDAIARAAGVSRQNSQMSVPGVLTPPDTQTLAPLAGPDSGYDPRIGGTSDQDELVGVVGPNGEILWVYEEQVPTLNSRVTIQRQQQVPQTNPFGFVYE
jgi:hypothetical protein